MYINIYLNNHFYSIDIKIAKNKENFVEVSNFIELQNALIDDKIKIIEIQNDLELGYNHIKEYIQIQNITSHNKPLTHPKLIQSGISKIKIKNKEELIIYSKNGAKIMHANIIIENSKNIKIENLIMEELWEWDEMSQGEYDINNWDYITIKNSENICITNCEFGKCYDSIIDIDNGKNITIEYCKVNEIDVNSEFYDMQFRNLEENIENYPMYKFLRKEAKLSIQEIKELVSYQYKVYTIGTKQENNKKNTNIVIHDNMYYNVKTRIPKLRNTKAYIYNIYVDSINISKLKKNMKDKFDLINSKYRKLVSFDTYGIIATENSRVFAENCIFTGIEKPYNIFSKNENFGCIVLVPNLKFSKEIKNKLEQVVGIKNEG